MEESNAIGEEPVTGATESGGSGWTEEKVRAMLAERDFGYQDIELPFGLSTGGGQRSGVAQHAFPSDMSGKSLFDLGCRNGYFCFEAESRGAGPIVGGELDPNSFATCEVLAEVLGSKAQFLQFDVERDPMPGRFDFVLCLNVLHHLRNPLTTLEKLIDATNETLVLEIASLTPKDRRESIPARLFGGLLNKLPILYLGGAGADNKSGRSYFITESAITTMLNKHRRDIAKVEIAHVENEKRGRFLAIAHKRRIGHLFLVIGTNAVGKSTLVGKWLDGKERQVTEAMGIDLSENWHHQRFNRLARSEEAVVPKMMLQFNVGKYLIDGDMHHYEKGLLDLIRCAERVTIATLWHPPEELHQRYSERIPKSWLRKRMRSKRDKKMHRTFMSLYSRPKDVASLFNDWFSFARQQTTENYVVLQDDGYRVVRFEDWTDPPR
jgi:SAM-dependent methyltransferase